MSGFIKQPIERIKESNVFEYESDGDRHFLLITEVFGSHYKRIVSRTFSNVGLKMNTDGRGRWKYLGYVPKEFLK